MLQQSNVTPAAAANTSMNSTVSSSALKTNVAPAAEKKRLAPKSSVSISESLPQSSSSKSSTSKATPTAAETTSADPKGELVTTTHRTGLGILQSLRSGTTTSKDTGVPKKKKLVTPVTSTVTATSAEVINEAAGSEEKKSAVVKTSSTATTHLLTALSKNEMKSTIPIKEKPHAQENHEVPPTAMKEGQVVAAVKSTAPNHKNNTREISKKQRVKKSSFKVKEGKRLSQETSRVKEEAQISKNTPTLSSGINFFSGQTLEETTDNPQKEKDIVSTVHTTSRKDKHATSALKALLKIQSGSSSSVPTKWLEQRLDMDEAVFSQFELKFIEQIEQQTETNIRSSSLSTNCYFLIRGYSMDFILTAKAMLLQQQEDFQQTTPTSPKTENPIVHPTKNVPSKKEKDMTSAVRKKQQPRSRRSSKGTTEPAQPTLGNTSSHNPPSRQKYVRVKNDKTRPSTTEAGAESKDRGVVVKQHQETKMDNNQTVHLLEGPSVVEETTMIVSEENNQEEHVEEDMKIQWARAAELDERSSKVFIQLPYHDAKKIMESYEAKQDSIKNPSAWFQKTCSNFKNRNVYHQSKIIPAHNNPSSVVSSSVSSKTPLLYDDLPPLEIMSPEMQPQDESSNIWKTGDAPPSSPSSGIGSHIHPPPQNPNTTHHPLGGTSSFSPWTVGKDWSFLSGR